MTLHLETHTDNEVRERQGSSPTKSSIRHDEEIELLDVGEKREFPLPMIAPVITENRLRLNDAVSE